MQPAVGGIAATEPLFRELMPAGKAAFRSAASEPGPADSEVHRLAADDRRGGDTGDRAGRRRHRDDNAGENHLARGTCGDNAYCARGLLSFDPRAP